MLAAALLLVGFLAVSAYMLPDQMRTIVEEPRFVPAIAVACWRFESLPVLTIRQRLLWRYTLVLDRDRVNLWIHFTPREPNPILPTEDERELPRGAWNTHVAVNPRTFAVVRCYLDRD
jgi:hypothetical protein